MESTTTITPLLLRALRTEIDAALAAIGEKHGITLKSANASYNASRFTMRIEAQVIGGQSKEAECYATHAAAFGLDPTWLGKEVRYASRAFTLAGMKSTGSILLDAGGRQYRCKLEDFKRAAKLVEAA